MQLNTSKYLLPSKFYLKHQKRIFIFTTLSVLLLIGLLLHKNLFLPLYFVSKLLFGWQISQILSLKQLLILLQDRILCHILTCLRTQNQAYRRIITIRSFQLIIHSDIHIHLPNILMRYLGSLQVICCVVNYVGFTSEKLIHKGFF